MKRERSIYAKVVLTLFGTAALIILFNHLLANIDGIGAFLNKVIGILMPFIIGGVIAYILTPICNFLEGKLQDIFKKRKNGTALAGSLSVILTLLFAVLVIIVLLVIVVPSLVESIYSIILQIPGSVQAFENWALKIAGDNETLRNYIYNLADAASVNLPEWLRSTILPRLQTMIGGISAGISGFIGAFYNLLMGIIISVYMLGNRKVFARQGKKLIYSMFSKRWADAVLNEFRYADKMFSGFISGRITDSMIIGVICFVGMLILKIPNPLLISVIVGVTNIIPFFGPYIGAIPSFLLILMTSPIKALIFLVFVIILQQFDGNILGPRILGNVTGLSSFWVLFAVLLFGGLFGFIGVLVGVPVFAVIYDVIRKLVNKGLAYHEEQAT